MLNELQELGLSKEEAKVYLALLEIQSGPASIVARRAAVPRVNCYYILDQLVKKGLVSTYMQHKVKTFSAENPKKFVYQYEEKLRQAKYLLPELMAVTSTSAFRPKIHFYEGLEGIKSIYEEMLESHDELMGYTDLGALIELLPTDYLKEYNRKKVRNKQKTRIISPYSKEGFNYVKNFYPPDYNSELNETLFVNPEEFKFENEIAIYGNKIAIISLNPDELIGVLIESSVIARTQQTIFDLAWLGATSFVAR
ncbi:MAG: helix-turn-helix domain-containing protein [Candidatus Gracilibacteria bacterium]|nr:helix-turn-helix domain-containing protein [Candidatus Gracilibacteria bacterium]